MSDLTTALAMDAIAYERAPRYAGRWINHRVKCADGFTVSVQASTRHYADDQTEEAPYWRLEDDLEPSYPFRTFEVAYPSEDLPEREPWTEDGGGVWAFTERADVEALLDEHGGAVGWQEDVR